MKIQKIFSINKILIPRLAYTLCVSIFSILFIQTACSGDSWTSSNKENKVEREDQALNSLDPSGENSKLVNIRDAGENNEDNSANDSSSSLSSNNDESSPIEDDSYKPNLSPSDSSSTKDDNILADSSIQADSNRASISYDVEQANIHRGYISKLEVLVEKSNWIEFNKIIWNKPAELKLYDILLSRRDNMLHKASSKGLVNVVITLLYTLEQELNYPTDSTASQKINYIIYLKNSMGRNAIELAREKNYSMKPIDDMQEILLKYSSNPTKKVTAPDSLKGNNGLMRNNENYLKGIPTIKNCDCHTVQGARRILDPCILPPPFGFKDGLNILLKCMNPNCGMQYWLSLGFGNFHISGLVPLELQCQGCLNTNETEESPSIKKIIVCHGHYHYKIIYLQAKRKKSMIEKKGQVAHLKVLDDYQSHLDLDYEYFMIKTRK